MLLNRCLSKQKAKKIFITSRNVVITTFQKLARGGRVRPFPVRPTDEAWHGGREARCTQAPGRPVFQTGSWGESSGDWNQRVMAIL